VSLSTHVLDTANGRPAAGVSVRCQRQTDDGWVEVATGTTDDDGRIGTLIAPGALEAGTYRLTFVTGGWASAVQLPVFFWPEVMVTFDVTAPDEHHHVPLLLSPFGYSTYRGS
jgi:5-hydroxyisourate hydrolase